MVSKFSQKYWKLRQNLTSDQFEWKFDFPRCYAISADFKSATNKKARTIEADCRAYAAVGVLQP